jgi:hypothetical protein
MKDVIAINQSYPCGCEMTTDLRWTRADNEPYWNEPFLVGCSIQHQATGPTDSAIYTELVFEDKTAISFDF